VNETVLLSQVANSDEAEFLTMAEAYFTELNPGFVAADDWRTSYFSGLRASPNTQVQWIQCHGTRAGFVIYGIERHHFLPRSIPHIYEFYVLPRFRRSAVGLEAAKQVLQALRQLSPSRIQLEITSGNTAAAEFWQVFGFRKVAERYVLDEGRK
jgi:ribosomal protein S18 acetylase RimI-like enzyme